MWVGVDPKMGDGLNNAPYATHCARIFPGAGKGWPREGSLRAGNTSRKGLRNTIDGTSECIRKPRFSPTGTKVTPQESQNAKARV